MAFPIIMLMGGQRQMKPGTFIIANADTDRYQHYSGIRNYLVKTITVNKSCGLRVFYNVTLQDIYGVTMYIKKNGSAVFSQFEYSGVGPGTNYTGDFDLNGLVDGDEISLYVQTTSTLANGQYNAFYLKVGGDFLDTSYATVTLD